MGLYLMEIHYDKIMDLEKMYTKLVEKGIALLENGFNTFNSQCG